MKRFVAYLFIPLILQACSTSDSHDYQYYFDRRDVPAPTAATFSHCHNYGCQLVQTIELSPKEWASIETYMKPPAKTPDAEREQIKKAIAQFEKTVGAIAKTDEDVYGTFKKTGRFQHDCVDESTNTTSYLIALKTRGLLKHHDVLSPSMRVLRNGFPGWPHQTAVIADTQSQERFAVDSWFRNNGYPPFIVPFDEWKSGWTPEDAMRPEIFKSKK